MNKNKRNIDLNMRDIKFVTKDGNDNIDLTKNKHLVALMNASYSDSNGCPRPKPLSDFSNEGNGKCVVSGNKIQRTSSCSIHIRFANDSYLAAHCL